MDNLEILKFKDSIKDFSVEELENEAVKIRDDISKMILDSDLILKAAIVDTLLKEKKGN